VIGDYEELLTGAGLLEFWRSQGLIVVYDRPEHFEQDRWSYELERELGFAWRRMEHGETQELAPDLRPGDGPTLFVPSWRHTVDPGRMTAAIAADAMRRGARWMREEVLAVSASAGSGPGGVQVTLAESGTLEADRLVIAAGAWSNRLAAQLDYAVPMAPKRGYHAMISNPGVTLDVPVMSGSRVFVMTPLAQGLRLAGTAEFARLDAPADHRRARVLIEHARRYFPRLEPQGVSEWMGQRPMMCDSLPVISRSPTRPEVIYAFGHGHYGLTQGPTTGRLVAALALGRDPGIDLAPYGFDRFAANAIVTGAVA
jgi:D-amino-acid dehydrogenase